MSCRGCGNKPSRYAVQSGDIDRKESNNNIYMNTNKDPLMEFVASKSATYEELTERHKFQQRLMEQQHNQMLAEMTDAMRRKYIDELVGVVNCQKIGVPGVSPGQALIILDEVLNRPDFNFISKVYPKLKTIVQQRAQELRNSFLPTE